MSPEEDDTPEAQVSETTPGRSRNMAAIRRSDTKPELLVRSALHRLGYRFRKDHVVVVDGVRTRPDIAFTRWRVAVFIDGCFWHSCPIHGRQPTKNTTYWNPKLQRNQERDRLQTEALVSGGWVVLRYWAHEDLAGVLESITAQLGRRRSMQD